MDGHVLQTIEFFEELMKMIYEGRAADVGYMDTGTFNKIPYGGLIQKT